MNLLRYLLGRTNKFTALEWEIANSVRSKLIGQDQLEKWDKQINLINKIQRLPSGLEINFYPMSKGKPAFDPEIAFQDKSDEFHLATVDIVSQSAEKFKLRARVWCVRGFFFMYSFSASKDVFEKQSKGHWRLNCRIENKL